MKGMEMAISPLDFYIGMKVKVTGTTGIARVSKIGRKFVHIRYAPNKPEIKHLPQELEYVRSDHW